MNERFEAMCKQKEEEEEKEVEFDDEEMIVEKEKPEEHHGLPALSESEESDDGANVETEKKGIESSKESDSKPLSEQESNPVSTLKMMNPRGYSSELKEEREHDSKEGASLLTLFSRAKARPPSASSASKDSSNPSNVSNSLNPSNPSNPSNSLNPSNSTNPSNSSNPPDGSTPSDPNAEAAPASGDSSPSIDENDYKEGEQPTAEDYARYRAMMKDSSWFAGLS